MTRVSAGLAVREGEALRVLSGWLVPTCATGLSMPVAASIFAPVADSVLSCAASEAVSVAQAAGFAEEVVLVVAGVDVDAAVFDLEDAGGEAVDEVAVVRDEEDGAGELFDGVEEHVFGAHVEVVGRLVEQEEVGGRDEHAGEGVAVALAAGEHAEGLEDVVAGEHEAAEEIAERDGVDARVGAGDVFEHARGGVEDLVLVLREVVGDDVVADADFAGGGLFDAGEHAHERGFAGAVDADERDAVAAIDGEGDVFEHALSAP